jgi:UTP--glucose-1-phosphate uridylyltransferase
MAHRPIRKAVFPVAGLGTRLLPATKAMPKEMLTLVDRPLIQHVVEEAKAAGITEFIFVTSSGKSLIEEHFDRQHHLIATLEARGKKELLQLALETEIPTGKLSVTRQHTPLGLGHAVWCARELVGNEPFAVILPDEIVLHSIGCLSQLMSIYQQTGGNVVALMDVPRDKTKNYGIVAGDMSGDNTMTITKMVEKPNPEDAPSTLSITGRYILQPEIFDHLEKGKKGAGGEIQLTDAMQDLLPKQQFTGVRFDGQRYDCGNKLGFIEANIAFSLDRMDMRDDVIGLLENYLTLARGSKAA